MKQISYYLILVCSIILTLSSCSSSYGPKDVAEKIENNEELTKEDYDIMMDYIEEKLTPFFENIRNEDESGSVNVALELNDDEIFKAFEKKLPDYETTLIQYLMFGFNPKEINRSRYYPASIKSDVEVVEEGVAETVEAVHETVESPAAEEVVTNGFQTDGEGNEIISHNKFDYDYHFRGKIGEFPIELHYSYDMDTMDGVEIIGFYEYTENGTILDLNGEKKNNGEVILNEFTKAGKNSGIFNLEFSYQDLIGKFTNKNNGKTYDVNLKFFRKF